MHVCVFFIDNDSEAKIEVREGKNRSAWSEHENSEMSLILGEPTNSKRNFRKFAIAIGWVLLLDAFLSTTSALSHK